MLEAILFDLDDTLLGNDISRFLKHYFPLLADHMSQHIEGELFLSELMYGTQAMISSEDPNLTNEDVFWGVFCRRTGVERASLQPAIDQFYEEKFGKLRQVTSVRPVAAELLRYCFSRGLKIAVATNPLFPLTAILQRLAWAEVPLSKFPYDLVTSYENTHAAKPSLSYYQEILAALDVLPDSALMVGDDWMNDIDPSSRLGLSTYWVSDKCEEPPVRPVDLDGCGTLTDLYELLQEGWLLQ